MQAEESLALTKEMFIFFRRRFVERQYSAVSSLKKHHPLFFFFFLQWYISGKLVSTAEFRKKKKKEWLSSHLNNTCTAFVLSIHLISHQFNSIVLASSQLYLPNSTILKHSSRILARRRTGRVPPFFQHEMIFSSCSTSLLLS